jgi:hypothetical protein
MFIKISSLLLFCLVCHSSSTNLRLLDSTQNLVKTNATVINILYPGCRDDTDCNMNGFCDITSKKCLCSRGYDTLLNKTLIKFLTDIPDQVKKSNISESIHNITISLKIDEIQYCNYKKKEQLTAFMLSFFVGFGAEHFYLERFNVGAAKLVFYTLCCALNIIYFILYKCVKDGKRYVEFIGTFEAFYLACGFFYMILWNVYDWVNIGYNSLLDGNEMQLLSWGNK